MTILVRNCSYLVRSPERIERECDLLLEGSRIAAIGQNLQAPPEAERIEADGCAVIPGLVNAHTHLYQNLLKGLSPGLRLVPWCNQVLFPGLGALRAAASAGGARLPYLWTALASIEMLRGGVTSCVDMDSNTSPDILQAFMDVGFRGVLAYTLSNKWVPSELRADERTMRAQVLEFIEKYHRPEGLTTVHIAPSTLFLCSDDFLEWAGEQAARHDLGLQIHIAETADEVDEQQRTTGRTPVEHLAYLGLLDDRLSAVHAVHVGERDIELLAGSGAQVVHCPKSNMKLADGVAPIPQMAAAGIPLALATDGCASNDLLDMWEEMRAAVLLARVSASDPQALAPAQVFRMATRGGAQVARLAAGELEVGMLADLAILELGGVHLRPLHDQDLLNSLVFCARAGDVRDTIVNGVAVLRDRRLTRVDEPALLAEADALAKELFLRPADPGAPEQRTKEKPA